jgi:hypothetical protein
MSNNVALWFSAARFATFFLTVFYLPSPALAPDRAGCRAILRPISRMAFDAGKYFLRINLFPLYSLPNRCSNTLEMTTWATEVGLVHET